MKGRRLSKREMKEDAFVTFAFRAADFIEEHKSKMILGVVLVALAIAGGAFIVSSRRSGNEEAREQLLAGVIQQRYGSYSGAAAAFEDVLARHRGTASGKLANLYLGHVRYEMGDFEAALEAYREYLRREKSDRLTVGQAKRGIAACLENTGKYEEAAELYEEVARSYDRGNVAAEDLMFAARCWRAAGQPDKAMKILQEVVDSYPGYQELSKAKVFLAELEYDSSR